MNCNRLEANAANEHEGYDGAPAKDGAIAANLHAEAKCTRPLGRVNRLGQWTLSAAFLPANRFSAGAVCALGDHGMLVA